MAARFPILYIAEAEPEAAVMSSGVLARLAEQAPGASFTIVGSSRSAPLFRDAPGLERLMVMDGEGRLDLLRLWWRVRGRRWGLIVDLRGTGLSGRLQRQRRAVADAAAGGGPWPGAAPAGRAA